MRTRSSLRLHAHFRVWRPEVIAKALARFNGPDYVHPGYSYAPWRELARLLASLAGGKTTNGSFFVLR